MRLATFSGFAFTAMFDLAEELPRLLPKAIAWAESVESQALHGGCPLDEESIRLARAVGVQHPDRIRVVYIRELPFPADAELAFAANETGLLGPDTAGLTLGYAVFVRKGFVSPRLISHEFRHVQQFEAAGSIAAALPIYLEQVLTHGYENAPWEIDARAHERDSI